MFTPLVAFTSQSLQAAALATEEPELSVEKIVVTVSRLKAGNQVSKAPINTINEESFAFTGNLSVSDAINELPQLRESFGSRSQKINFLNDGFNTGTSLVNLLNLGSKRTLVLVNGRRHISGAPGTMA
jgi:outer membrane receptor for ferrienterochelin and colicin